VARSFGIVENKLRESKFFLNMLETSVPPSFEADCYFSAFVSACRSVTFALQASLKGMPNFDVWYAVAQQSLKTDPLAPLFLEFRNEVVHIGENPINRVSLDHLAEHLSRQFNGQHSHVLVLPGSDSDNSQLVDAVVTSNAYFTSLVGIIYDCYDNFRTVVDPQWYFTEENFISSGRTIRDAVVELGFPETWCDAVPSEDAWKAIRSQQTSCLVNDIFEEYLGKTIPTPDSVNVV